MKKFKKVFAVLLTLAMVLGMSMTSFATEYKIKVEGAGEDATFHYVQIVKPNPTKKTGWEFTNNVTDGFKTAILERDENITDDDDYDQAVIAAMTASGFQETTLRTALNQITATGEAFGEGVKEVTVPSAGLYKVTATEDNYSYSPMAAYVAFEGTGATATVTAKRQEVAVKKTSQEKDTNGDYKETDKVVYVGEKIQYTIETTVPYFENKDNRKYEIKDVISGANYVVDTDNKVILSVKLDNENITPTSVTMDTNGFTVDLSNIATDTNVNKALTITYEAIVTGTKVTNTARPYYNSQPGGTEEPDPVELFVGTATITKVDFNSTATKLSGAKFKIKDTVTGLYATLGANNTVTGWDENGTETSETDTNGVVTVTGLSKDGTFVFEETTAPQGYSLSGTLESIAWGDVSSSQKEENGKLVTIYTQAGTAQMKDTKLSGLPSTGGIGTTIFTIGGCAIMIIAAALFFASRRKAAK